MATETHTYQIQEKTSTGYTILHPETEVSAIVDFPDISVYVKNVNDKTPDSSGKVTLVASDVGALPTGTTLDSIADGSTRKLSNYIAKSIVTTAGDLILGNGNASVTRLAKGSNLQVLRVNSSGNVAWASLGAAADKAVVTTVDTSASLPTSGAVKTYVDNAIGGMAKPMIFKGSIGTGGTITWANLPTASTSEGFTYKVIEKHTSAPVCEVGDTIVSNGTTWVVIPSGDEPSGTVTSVGASGDTWINISGSPITSSGTITITHKGPGTGSALVASAGSGRTYVTEISADSTGHITGIKTATETVTQVTSDTVKGWGYINKITLNGADKTTTNGTVALGKLMTGLTASGDVSGTASVANDGSSTVSLSLATISGLTAGTYSAVTVNTKGQVTKGYQSIQIASSTSETMSSNLVEGGLFFKMLA